MKAVLSNPHFPRAVPKRKRNYLPKEPIADPAPMTAYIQRFTETFGPFFPAKLRAARAFMNWTREELAERCFLSVSTIRRMESDKFTQFRGNISSLWKIVQTYEEFGVNFKKADVKAGIQGGLEFRFASLETIQRRQQFGLAHGHLVPSEDDTA